MFRQNENMQIFPLGLAFLSRSGDEDKVVKVLELGGNNLPFAPQDSKSSLAHFSRESGLVWLQHCETSHVCPIYTEHNFLSGMPHS